MGVASTSAVLALAGTAATVGSSIYQATRGTPKPPPIPAAPPSALPPSMANTSIAATAASQRAKASAAGTAMTPDMLGAPATAKSTLLGAT